ncbi:MULTISPECIES: hypothetical protein [Streptosporangium]|uniref:CBM-cenC domain-containing protein n=1 Tax=Streptosporangium brasiliense TaxID=47480 RepID=A0ABT9RNP2_9ACTN|nr:hypothetical protein [Streptosporangium brasiliense]MDP9870456.1 hypothetical protein [Streptosporangium brasiliense]
MAIYANYVTNPTFELGTALWEAENGASFSRVAANPASGTYSLRLSNFGSQNVYGGVRTTVPVEPGGLAYSLSLSIKGITESHGSGYNDGVRVTVYDLLPGAAMSARVQVATQTFARTTNGRVAVRNLVPRAGADRLVIAVTTASSYYQAGSTSTSYGSYQDYTDGPVSGGGWIVVSPSTYTSMLSSPNWQGSTSHTTGSQRFGSFRTVTTITNPPISGGTSSADIDAVKLEQGTTETGYVDGSSPGYVWSGAAHASATLAMVALSAAGAGAMTSPAVEMIRLKFLQGSGSGASTGSAQLSAEGTVKASGTGKGTGRARLWSSGAFSASGVGGSLGSAYLYRIVPISASGEGGPGTGLDAPRVIMFKAWPTFADGHGVGGGSASLSPPQPISMSGAGVGGGSAQLGIGLQLVATGYGVSVGSADLTDGTPDGAFTDFAIWGAAPTENDPLQFGTGATNAGITSGANGQPWNRVHAEFIAPADQPAGSGKYVWRRAAYAAVGFRFNAVPAANFHEVACVQVEPSGTATSPGPRPYTTAQTLVPLVIADRANYAEGVLWTSGDATNLTVTEDGVSPVAGDVFPARKITYGAGSTGFVGGSIVTPPPGADCVLSLYVHSDGSLPEIVLKVTLNGPPYTTLGQLTVPMTAGWKRIEVPFRSVVAGVFLEFVSPPANLPRPATFWAAGVMVEQATKAGSYFHLVAGSKDYYYRGNGGDPTKGVFWYPNIEERTPALMAALEEHAPLGVRIGTPRFGDIPHLD